MNPDPRSLDIHRLPLVALADEVCFPRTEVRLQIVEPAYCDLLDALWRRDGAEGRIGLVLSLEAGDLVADALEGVAIDAGTSARLIAVDRQADGCSVVLEGERRFRVEREVDGGRWREAWVRPLLEPEVSELDPDVQSMRRELIVRTSRLAVELGERFALDSEQLRLLASDLSFEAMVNHLAANMDMAPIKKLQLLRTALPDRALSLLTILQGRQHILDLLRPYRHLADHPELS
ncbi:MAG: LON peptidase substrate-binding domain-containing protein [Acidobacteriota bacterium]